MRQRPKSLKSKAKLPVAAKSPKNQSSKVRDLGKRLAEELEQRIATSEILRVISRSPTAVQPVFETIVQNAARLCDAVDTTIFQVASDSLILVAHHGPIPSLPVGALRPLAPGTPTGRAVLEARTIHIVDLQTEGDEYPEGSALARALDFRSVLSVPLIRAAAAIGTIVIRRIEARPFTERQTEILKTFADQAVIAIENVRLFKELQEKNQALTQSYAQVTESLDQQTATSEILRVISSSPTDVRPVFDTIVQNARRLCGADSAGVLTYDGKLIHIESLDNDDPERADALRGAYPRPANREHATGRAILLGRPVQIPDVLEDPEYALPLVRNAGIRSVLAVPMVRDGIPIGAIAVQMWVTPRPYSDEQIGLLNTFADQAVIAIENVRLFKELEVRNRDLSETLEQQVATADILKVISASPTDVQPVFEMIAARAMSLCGADLCLVQRPDGDQVYLAAIYGADPASVEVARNSFPMPLSTESLACRAMRGQGIVHVADVLSDPTYELKQQARAMGFRSGLAVPMLRDEQVIGAIYVGRAKTGLFSPKQVELLQTFADQAVIAVENVRLFTELQTSNRELTTALDKQTATSDILSVISRSQTNIQPVFDAIVHSAVRLLGGYTGGLTRVEGDQIVLVALTSVDASADAAVSATFPDSLQSANPHARAVRERMPLNIADAHTDSRLSEATRAYSRTRRFQSWALVPLLRQAEAIGGIGVTRRAPGGFSDDEIALLKTFADQAVIAIENVRLFKELESSNHELRVALEQQTATSELLKVIGRSTFDLQPVFETLAENAVRLCAARLAFIYRFDGQRMRAVASYNVSDDMRAFVEQNPIAPGRHTATARAALERRTIHIHDVRADSEYTYGAKEIETIRTVLVVPMLRAGELLGAIQVYRHEVRPFTAVQIALMETFADQAAIAIENARLLSELRDRTAELTRSVGELKALGEVGRAVSSTLDLQTVLDTIVARAVQLSGTGGGFIYEFDDATQEFHLRATHQVENELAEAFRAEPIRLGEGATGRAAATRAPVQITDTLDEKEYTFTRIRSILARLGYRSVLAVPLLLEQRVLGALVVHRRELGTFAPEVVNLLQTFATQSALAIQNARLFREIEVKSHQLEVASQHKSEFLANMSHELRTPLNAIIGFSEVLTDRMFGELNEKQEEYLKDIYASGTHLLSLINDILDLSKIEAGRMELELTEFDLPTAIENALMLVRERAGRRSIALHTNIDNRLGQIQADERKVRQVVLNLLSNAIKFTPEGGRIDVGAVPHDGSVEISVSDTGIGIAPEDQEKVFEEFRQVGTPAKKVEGTGLGLTLCRKFAELHGGRIGVKSQVGLGSTFTFTIPVRRDQ